MEGYAGVMSGIRWPRSRGLARGFHTCMVACSRFQRGHTWVLWLIEEVCAMVGRGHLVVSVWPWFRGLAWGFHPLFGCVVGGVEGGCGGG